MTKIGKKYLDKLEAKLEQERSESSLERACYAALVQKWRRRACRLWRKAEKEGTCAPEIYYRVCAQEAGRYAKELNAALKAQQNAPAHRPARTEKD